MTREDIKNILNDTVFASSSPAAAEYVDTAVEVLFNIKREFGNPIINQHDLPLSTLNTYRQINTSTFPHFEYRLEDFLLTRATKYLKKVEIKKNNLQGQYLFTKKSIQINEDELSLNKFKMVDESFNNEVFDLPNRRKDFLIFTPRNRQGFDKGEFLNQSDKHGKFYIEVITEEEAAHNFAISKKLVFAHEFLHALKSEYSHKLFNIRTGFQISKFNIMKNMILDECINDLHAIRLTRLEEYVTKKLCYIGNNDEVYTMQRLDSNNAYSEVLDIAEFLEMIIGEKKLFMGAIVKPEHLINMFNAKFNDVFYNNTELKIMSKKVFGCSLENFSSPWEILSNFSAKLVNKSANIKMMQIKKALHYTLIRALAFEIASFKPQDNNLASLKEQYERLIKMPERVYNLMIMQKEDKGKENQPVYEEFLKLNEICNRKCEDIKAGIDMLSSELRSN